MQVIDDNELIFRTLDGFNQLPQSFSFDAVYSFVHASDFFLVIYTPAGDEKGFLLLRLNDFRGSTYQLNEVILWLQDKMKTHKGEIWEMALDEMNRVIGTGGNEGMFFDAH
jgi:hypothetical protein